MSGKLDRPATRATCERLNTAGKWWGLTARIDCGRGGCGDLDCDGCAWRAFLDIADEALPLALDDLDAADEALAKVAHELAWERDVVVADLENTIGTQRALLERAIVLLRCVHDSHPCRLDHNGDCQEHDWFGGPCGNAQMAELFTDVGALGVNRG